MLVAVLLVSVHLLLPPRARDKVTIRPAPKAVVDREFGRPEEYRPSEMGQAYINGRAAGVGVPLGWEVYEDAWNRRGRVIGVFSIIKGEPSYVDIVGFTTASGKLETLPFRPDAIDDLGRVVGLTGNPPVGPPHWYLDPYYVTHQGWLFHRSRVTRLGSAMCLRFRPNGDIEGYAATDPKGFPFREEQAEELSASDVRYRRFVWRGGKRIEGGHRLRPPSWAKL